MKNFPILLALLVPMMSHALPGWTQTKQRNPAFEFGLGGAAMNYTDLCQRFQFEADGSYVFDLKSKQSTAASTPTWPMDSGVDVPGSAGTLVWSV